MYHGKLYGKLWDKYFDTDHTTDEWDAMEKQIKELKAENEALKKANGVSMGKRQLTKPAVINRRELLIDFCSSVECYQINTDQVKLADGVDKYLKSINSL